MSESVQWVIVGLIVVAAIVFLVARLKPTDKGGCAGCPYAGACQYREQRGKQIMTDAPSFDSSGWGGASSGDGENISSRTAL